MHELALASHAAKIRGGQLRQHELFTLDAEHAVVLLGAFGMPRLWGYALNAAEKGFRRGFGQPYDGRASSRLHQGLDNAQRVFRARVDLLIEQKTPDVSLLALVLAEGKANVLSVGPGRLYLARGGETKRLTPREDMAEGMLRASAAFCSEPVQQGDLLIGGSHTAFLPAAREALRTELQQTRRPSPMRLVELLNAKAVESGLGVGSFALRL